LSLRKKPSGAQDAGSIDAVRRPTKAPPDGSRLGFTRSTSGRGGIAWYGIRSFWGHLQHFVASAIATEDIDSRDWMHPDDPHKLTRRVLRQLGGDESGGTVVEGLGRDLWIDFLADTGDDPAIAARVAELLAAPYELPDPERPGEFLHAPRGDIFLHGGDIAYPVATADEIHDRFVVPFNRAFAAHDDGTERVMLGVPGNHDWYDGLDGFARLFRRRVGTLAPEGEQASFQPDGTTRLAHIVDWAEKFVVGKSVTKRKALVLQGYVPVQYASYFILPLAPKLHLFGVDRQLRAIDFRQRRYFTHWANEHPSVTPFVLLPDPARAFLEPSASGVAMIRSLELDLHHKPHLVLAGDVHHYERWRSGKSTHVIAGGGGAFLHPPRLARKGYPIPEAEWPGPAFARRALWKVPLHVALGRAGFVPHLVLALFFAPALGIGLHYFGAASVDSASAVGSMFGTILCALVGGWRKGRFLRITSLAGLTGITMGLVPTLSTYLLQWILALAGWSLGPRLHALVVLVLAVFVGALAFGGYLAALTRWGLEHTQAFTALAHPGFKQFLRVRVRATGDALDVWSIGLVDPLCPGEPPVLVDAFTFHADGRTDAMELDPELAAISLRPASEPP
jgi:hypothetical protein